MTAQIMLLLVVHTLIILPFVVNTLSDTQTPESIFCNETMECISDILPSNNVYCAGFHGCTESVITSNRITCDGSYSCFRASLSATSILSCNGHSACFNTTQATSSEDVVSCGGKYGCAWSQQLISTKTGVHCDGYMSCMYANIIKTGVIVGNGQRALNNANIDSADAVIWFSNTKGMVVNSKGFMSGAGANIYCRNGTECTVLCDGSGCLSMNVYCFYGSHCIIDPVQCGDNQPLVDNMVTEIEGIKCPNVYLSTTFEEDDVINDLMEIHEDVRLYDLDMFLSTNAEYQYEETYRNSIKNRIAFIQKSNEMEYYNNMDGIMSISLIVVVLLTVVCVYNKIRSKEIIQYNVHELC